MGQRDCIIDRITFLENKVKFYEEENKKLHLAVEMALKQSKEIVEILSKTDDI